MSPARVTFTCAEMLPAPVPSKASEAANAKVFLPDLPVQCVTLLLHFVVGNPAPNRRDCRFRRLGMGGYQTIGPHSLVKSNCHVMRGGPFVFQTYGRGGALSTGVI